MRSCTIQYALLSRSQRATETFRTKIASDRDEVELVIHDCMRRFHCVRSPKQNSKRAFFCTLE